MCLAFVVHLGIKVTTESGVFCRRTGRTKTFYVREAILEHVEDLEEVYLAESG
jgi:RHH-type rel operon transcriptional repressor/antitoxin RelB